MHQYNILIHTEDERIEMKRLLHDYSTQPKIASKIHGDLIYQVDMNTKQIHVIPAFMILENLGVVIMDLDKFKNRNASKPSNTSQFPILMTQEVCDKDDP